MWVYMTDIILEVRNLKKQFAKLNAVDGVSFSVKQGDCFGLLGPNGAGKTTTIEMMEAILPKSSGDILFKGQPLNKNYSQHIGIQFQNTALQDYLTVLDTLKLFSSFYQEPVPIELLIENCSLGDYLHQDSRKLSGGQRQRLLLALALVNDPDLLFLDEPTTGLDPHARFNFWQLMRSIKSQGKTIILTTHYMDEAQALCDTIGIMDKGKLIELDQPKELLKRHFEGTLIRLPMSSGIDCQRWPVTEHGDQLQFLTRNVNETLEALSAQQVDLSDLVVKSPNLDDLFLKLTGHSLGAMP